MNGNNPQPVQAHQGEPWSSSENLWTVGIQVSAAALALLLYRSRGEEFLVLAGHWVDAHPVWSGAICWICLVIALVLGAMRQACIRMMSLVVAIPVVDEGGRSTWMLLGDVPFLWQEFPWVRAGTWMVVAATSIVWALIGAQFLSQAFGGGYALLAALLLLFRWAVSSLPRRYYLA